MYKLTHLARPTITTNTGAVISVDDDSVLCTDNIHTQENVQRILAKNGICSDIHLPDWIISHLPRYYMEDDVVRIAALLI